MGVDEVTRAVFLDRDGVLNDAVMRKGRPYAPATAREMRVADGAVEALQRLKDAGYRLIVVTNQPDVARGIQPRDEVEAIHAKLREALPLDEILACYHDGDDCECRKPKAGMLFDAAARYDIDLERSFLIGDRWRDVGAAHAAGATALFIDRGYDEQRPDEPFVSVASITEAVEWILTRGVVQNLRIKLFADGADRAGMLEMYANPLIRGFTTNPTLMRKAGVTDYRAFAREIVEAIPDRPISFEVFADDFGEMARQAREIATWGANVYVKIPVTNTRREPSYELVRRLSAEGMQLNVTALLTLGQVREVVDALRGGAAAYISIFAGRIADTGRDPLPVMAAALELLQLAPRAELIWASPRELLNVFQADAIGCHIITATNDILRKLSLVGRDLDDYSLETVQMFFDDGRKAGYTL